jgi:ABC-type dipeptide/oligopeptide/nickel transport system permease subunit
MLEFRRKNFERSPAFQFFAGTLIALFVAAFYVVGDWLFRVP